MISQDFANCGELFLKTIINIFSKYFESSILFYIFVTVNYPQKTNYLKLNV